MLTDGEAFALVVCLMLLMVAATRSERPGR